MKTKNMNIKPMWMNVLEWVGIALMLIMVLAWQNIFGHEFVSY